MRIKIWARLTRRNASSTSDAHVPKCRRFNLDSTPANNHQITFMPFIMDPEPMEADEGDYTHAHRAFLQSLLAHSTLTFETAKPILAAALTAADPARETLPNDITEADLNNFIATINATVSPFDLEIRSTLSQHDRSRIFALVNTTSDAITQLATTYTPDEIAWIKRVLDEMFIAGCKRTTELFAVQGMKAVNLASAGTSRQSGVNGHATTTINSDDEMDGAPAPAASTQPPGEIHSITRHQAENLLDTLVQEGWFEVSRKKIYSLAPRALMELRGWLIETYNDDEPEDDQDEDDDHQPEQRIKFCAACRDMVTIGQRCPDLDCKARLHDHCTTTMWRSQGGRERCPLCKKKWEKAGFVGERALRVQQRPSTGEAGPSRRRSDVVQLDGTDDAEDGDEGSDEG